MKPVLSIDPGNTESQLLIYDGSTVVMRRFAANAEIAAELPALLLISNPRVCIEMIASYGMPVGAEVFDTCVWIGRFVQVCASCDVVAHLVFRKDVKLHLCGTAKAKDGNIRQAIIDKFGGKDAAIGKKKTPGPLYGVASHAWAALALAITFAETQPKEGDV